MPPNQPRPDNPGRVIRIDSELWEKVKVLAEARDMTPSDVVRAAVLRYVNRPPKGTS